MFPAALAVSLALAAGSQTFDHVVVISVDGLRADMLEKPQLASLPNFARLLQGPHTLEARSDPQYTITLPNHISMITGRPVLGPFGHGWTANGDPADPGHGGTLHASKGVYITSMFDVAHDAGLATSCCATKSKFWLFAQSYNWSNGQRDTTGDDNGAQKLDSFVLCEQTADAAAAVADRLRRQTKRSLDFLHCAAPDVAGHSYDWRIERDTPYFASVKEVDRALGTLLEAIDTDPDLRGHTALILTADHGGGVPRKTHTDITCPVNFRIPFLVWMGDGVPPSDLQALNPDRLRPAREQIGDRDGNSQPIRNGDAANAALALLGLPSIPGSFYGAERQLRFVEAPDSKKTPSN